MNFSTTIIRIPKEQRQKAPCFVCGEEGKHPYFDPATHSAICDEDMMFVLRAELALAKAPGIRPPSSGPESCWRPAL